MELRDLIRKILRESLPSMEEGVEAGTTFPYGGNMVDEPQNIDPLTDYFLDWQKFSQNDSVFDFPKDEFNLGMRVERNKDPKASVLDLAQKVIQVLKDDPQFYSNLSSRKA